MRISRKIKNIVLIFPTGKVMKGHMHHCEVPMGLAYLAAVARNDFKVHVIDGRAKNKTFTDKDSKWEYFGYTPQEIVSETLSYDPDLVGISCLSSFHFPEVCRIASLIKKADKSIITVTGGTHPTFLAEQVMRANAEIDFIVLGEGEQTFKELLLNISEGREYGHLNGLAFRDNGSFKINPRTDFIDNLDLIPFPAFDLFPLDYYEKNSIPFSITFKNRKNAPVMTSRGCTSRCVFCASKNYWGNRYRTRSPDNILDEIGSLIKNHGVREIQFIDDNLTLDKQRAEKIFKGIIERKFNIHWNTPNGIAVWTLDEPMLELMKKSGCYELTVAFESGDQDVLNKIIKKPLNLKHAEVTVKAMKKLGIQVHSFFISGFPGETREQIKRTFDFAWKMDLDSAWFFMANPTPGSELYDICREKGYIKDDFSFDDIEYSMAHIETEDFTRKEIERMVLTQFNVYNICRLFRDPAGFLKKYFLIIIRHPRKIFRSILADIKKVLSIG